MFPLHRVLCPLDFSRSSLRALEAAKEIAMQYDAKIDLVHVIPPMPVSDSGIGYNAPNINMNVGLYLNELEESTQYSLEKIVEDTLSEIQSGITKNVLRGKEADKIVQFARESDSDLIVISTHGKTGLKRLLLGSVAEGIIRHAPAPVLSIRISESELREEEKEKE